MEQAAKLALINKQLIAFYPYSEYHQITIKDNNTHISDAYAKTN